MFSPAGNKYALLVALLTPFAQSIAHAEEVRLPAMNVTAPPLSDERALNATAVDDKTLNRLTPATSDSASLLQNVPGLNIQSSGGVAGFPVIHGLADDRLRIKVDGMDLISACGNHMNPALSYIDPTSVNSATVFAGITPVSVGGDSIGGTIIVDSIKPEFAIDDEILQTGNIGAFYRSNGNVRGGNLAATIANETLNLSYRASTTRSENYSAGDDFKIAGPAAAGRGWLEADEVGSTMYKSINQSLALAVRQDNHLFELKFGVQDIPYQGWQNQRMDMTLNDSTQTNLRYEGDYDWGVLEARFYNENTRHKMQFGEDKLYWYGAMPAVDGIACVPSGGMMGCAAGMPMDTEGDNTGAIIKADITLTARDILRVGGEIQQYRLDDWWDASGKGMWPNVFWNIRNGERDRNALFAELETEWNTRWLSQLGIRGEQVSMNAGDVQGYTPMMANYMAESAAFNSADRNITDNNIDLTALARFTPESTHDIEFGYARKTRSPSLYERYTWSTGGMAMRMINWAGDGNGYVGNLNLEPEVAHTISSSFGWHDANEEQWQLKITPYYTHINDYIDVARCVSVNMNCGMMNQTTSSDFVYLQFVNQTARIHGVDISAKAPLTDDNEYGDFSVTAIVNYVRGKNDTTDDNLYNIMPLNARLGLEQQLTSWTNAIELELVDAKDKVSQVRNEIKTSGYGLLHLRSSYEWKQLRFDLGVENLLDRFYNEPLGGTYLGQGKTMSGTDIAWGTPVPGMGRSIYAGVNLSF